MQHGSSRGRGGGLGHDHHVPAPENGGAFVAYRLAEPALTWLRTTTPPTFRLTVSPKRLSAVPFFATITTNRGLRIRLPADCVRR